jgi:hypothetical protein
MAIFIVGKTKCCICGHAVESVSEAKGFPAFLSKSHRFAKYSDSIMHLCCFQNCSEQNEVETLFQQYQQIWDTRPTNLQSLDEIEAWGKEAFRDF